jgi:hypothetical protein
MTAWALSFGWNWLLVPVALWFTRRFWLATREPGLKYIEHSAVRVSVPFVIDEKQVDYLDKWLTWLKHPSLRGYEGGVRYPKDPPPQPGEKFGAAHLLTVRRRERLFPWARNVETWLVQASGSTRESDGELADEKLHRRFLGMIAVADARKSEIEELSR